MLLNQSISLDGSISAPSKSTVSFFLPMTIADESTTDCRKLLLPPLPPQAAGAGLSSDSNKLLMIRRGFQVPSALDIAGAAAGNGNPLFKDAKEYTSLRDILGWSSMPVGLPSPTTPGSAGCPGEVRIRNRLVQQAAQAYLQPTPSAACHRRRSALPDCCDVLSGCLRFLGGVCRTVCRSFCPFRWRAIYIVDTKC